VLDQSDFNKGVEFAVSFIKKELLNGSQPLVSKEKIEKVLKKIPLKCNFCTKPCGNSWCSTVKKEK